MVVMVGKGRRMFTPWRMLSGVVSWLAWRRVALNCLFIYATGRLGCMNIFCGMLLSLLLLHLWERD